MTRSQLIFQRDESIVLTQGDGRAELLDLVRLCAELRAVVAGAYVFVLSPLVLWGAAARGLTASSIIESLDRAASVPIPGPFAKIISETMGRYGRLNVVQQEGTIGVAAHQADLLEAIGLHPVACGDRWFAAVDSADLAGVKIRAARAGRPIADQRSFGISTGATTIRFLPELRAYQRDALDAFLRGGSGLILLPCGAGKTVVGVAASIAVARSTLVLVPSRSVGAQWQASFSAFTTISADNIVGVGTSRLAPVTIATYHAATGGRLAGSLIDAHWDLVIYDEVQSLPADMFRLAAAFQSSRRLGLTATLVREDGRERDIAALVGPPLHDVSWTELERQGWIAPARCIEVRLPVAESMADGSRFKLAALQRLLGMHRDDHVIVAGTAVATLRRAGARLGFPVLTGASAQEDRARLLAAFRDGQVPVIGLSRIGSVGLDLPNANVLIQLSGTFGSRQEEAQRLGRLLRPQPAKTALFYSLVSGGTREEDYAARRQRFLVTQGYHYEVWDGRDLPRPHSN